MKRILHISKYYKPFIGGIEEMARDNVLALKGKAVQKVLCFNHEPHSEDSSDMVDGVEVIRIGQQFVIRSQPIARTYRKRLKEILRDFRPDIIIFHYPNPFACHYLLKYIPDHVKLIIWWHTDIYKQKILKYLFCYQNHKLLKHCDCVVLTSPNYLEGNKHLKKIRNKCTVIPNCIDENRLKVTDEEKQLAADLRRKNKGKILCLAVGRLVPYKGFEYLIKASELLDDRFVIQIAGDGPLREKLCHLAADNPKVEILGKVSDTELKVRLISCDIFTFSSITKNEGFGIALAEGMYFGHPAVTFTIPGSGVNYVSIDGLTGIEVPNKDEKKFAEAIKVLGDHPDLREKLGKAARERVLQLFLFDTYKRNVNKLIAKMGNENDKF